MPFYVWLREGHDVYSGEAWPRKDVWSDTRDPFKRDINGWYAYRGFQITERIPMKPRDCELWRVEVDGNSVLREGELFWERVMPVEYYGALPDTGWQELALEYYDMILDNTMAHPDYAYGYGMDTHQSLKRQQKAFKNYAATGDKTGLEQIHFSFLRWCLNAFEAKEMEQGWMWIAFLAQNLKREHLKHEVAKRLVDRLAA